jgi:hypothetical protein
LRRRRRKAAHRLLSIVYPVRAYECTAACTWTGVLPSPPRLARRKRQIRWVLAIVVLGIAAGLAVWKYGAGLTWHPVRPPAGDDAEEVSADQ